MRQFLSLFLTMLLTLAAQQPPPAAPSAGNETTPKFTSNTQLVVETVIVKDKNGNPVEGLTAKDFTITEDGKPQAISFCEYQTLKEAPEAAPALLANAAPALLANAETPKVDSVTRNQIAPEVPGNIQHRDKRMLGMYFDMSAMPIPGPVARSRRGRKIHQDQNDSAGPHGHHEVLRQRRRSARRLHRQSR